MSVGMFFEEIINEQFFRTHINSNVQQIKKAILQATGMNNRQAKEYLAKMLHNYVRIVKEASPADNQTQSWKKALQLADDWNRYELQSADQMYMGYWIKSGKVRFEPGHLVINKETWSLLTAWAYFNAKPRESVNHLFLKRLMKLSFIKSYDGTEVDHELPGELFSERIRYDVVAIGKDGQQIIGEVGGVQLWKVMAALEMGSIVYVLPHWTQNKTNPFTKLKREYDYFMFERRVK